MNPSKMAGLLDRLPYDVLRLVFDFLDVETLLDAALASHALNEIASLSLYTSITFNSDTQTRAWHSSPSNYQDRRNPIIALERRPHLREVVRSVVLYTADTWLGNQTTDADLEYLFQALLRLPSVTCLTIGNCSLGSEKRWIAKLLPQLSTLRTLDIVGYGGQADDYNLSLPADCDIHAWLTYDALSGFLRASLAPNVRKFSWDSYSWNLTPQELVIALSPFTRLTTFSIASSLPSTACEICMIVRGIPSLREVSFLCVIRSEDTEITPTGAKCLTHLRIKFRPRESTRIDMFRQFVKCVAGSSQLRILEIVPTRTRRKTNVLRGDVVVNHIISIHGSTLQKLKLPNFHLSSALLKRTILHCKQLRALWIGIPQNIKTELPALLAPSTSLEKIRIYAEGRWDYVYVNSLFHQTCQSLSVFKVCTTSGYQKRKTEWKYLWANNIRQKELSRRVVLGPVAVQYP